MLFHSVLHCLDWKVWKALFFSSLPILSHPILKAPHAISAHTTSGCLVVYVGHTGCRARARNKRKNKLRQALGRKEVWEYAVKKTEHCSYIAWVQSLWLQSDQSSCIKGRLKKICRYQHISAGSRKSFLAGLTYLWNRKPLVSFEVAHHLINRKVARRNITHCSAVIIL